MGSSVLIVYRLHPNFGFRSREKCPPNSFSFLYSNEKVNLIFKELPFPTPEDGVVGVCVSRLGSTKCYWTRYLNCSVRGDNYLVDTGVRSGSGWTGGRQNDLHGSLVGRSRRSYRLTRRGSKRPTTSHPSHLSLPLRVGWVWQRRRDSSC